MSYVYIRTTAESGPLVAALDSAERVALDCEAAGFHRYSDRLCLVQLTVGEATFILDPLELDPAELLKPVLEDPSVPVLMHGADFDLRLLKRDLGIRLRGLIDTQVSAALLGEEGLGLASLLESRLGVTLSKKYQRADWASRPLTDGMLAYAAADTQHLPALEGVLREELASAERLSWAEEEWLALEAVADEHEEATEPEDPVVRVKGAKKLPIRALAALRVALQWRDGIAQTRDRAPFRVIGDQPLIQAAMEGVRRVEDLIAIKGFPKALAREEGKRLIADFRRVAELPEEELAPFPKGFRRGPSRPPQELESLVERLKSARNDAAERIGLPRGTLLPNAVLIAVARAHPKTPDELGAVEGMRAWRQAVVGDDLLEVVRRYG